MSMAPPAILRPAADRDPEVKSLIKALDLLCCFTTEHPEWGVTELAQYLGLYKSTAHRLLSTFEKMRFVERTPTRRYRLGIRTVELGHMFQLNDRLICASERGLRRLAEETQSITHLTKLDGRDTVELLRFSAVENGALPGSKAAVRREAHATAKGKIFLAYSPEFFQRFVGRRQFFKKYTFLTIDTPEKLRQELAQIVKQGYAVDNQESRTTMRCIAVPVYMGGKLAAAVSLSNTTENLPIEGIPLLLPRLLRLSKSISSNLVSRRI
jgi:DNA-binding IclR family transcriptional regulator